MSRAHLHLVGDEDLVPVWMDRLNDWWQGLLGPTLGRAWEAVSRQAGNSSLLTGAYAGTVQEFVTALDALTAEADAFERLVDPAGPWGAYSLRTRQIASMIRERWRDPAATGPAAPVAGPLGVLRIGNITVTAIGVAWAVAALAEVTLARRHLRRWSTAAAEGRGPTLRDARAL
jgi:hypothetical protein